MNSWLSRRSNATLSVGDSAIVSLLGFYVVWASAKLEGASSVGLVALASSAVLLCVGFHRMLIGLPVIALGPTGGESKRNYSFALSVYFGIFILSISLTAALVAREPLIAASGVWAFMAVVQDAQRYAAMLLDRYRLLLALDLVLLASSIAFVSFATSVTALILALALGAVPSTAAGIAALELRPQLWLFQVARWWRSHLMVRAGPLALDGAIFTVASQGFLWILAGRSSVEEVGELRLALLFGAPFTIVMAGLLNSMIQAYVHQDSNSRRISARRHSLWLALGGSLMGLLLLAVAPYIVAYAENQGTAMSLTAIHFVLINSILLLVSTPAVALAITQRGVLQVATIRTVAGLILLILMAISVLGTSAAGAAAATAIASLVLVVGVLAVDMIRKPPGRNG